MKYSEVKRIPNHIIKDYPSAKICVRNSASVCNVKKSLKGISSERHVIIPKSIYNVYAHIPDAFSNFA